MSDEKGTSSLLDRLGRLFGRGTGREKEHAGEEEKEQLQNDRSADFSALDLRDRVVVMLLFDQIVSIEQVEAAWNYWQRMSEEEAPSAFWYLVARLPEVDREAVFAQAARVYAFERIDFNMYDARKLLRDHRHKFSRRQCRRMIELNLALVFTDYVRGELRWIFATHDPTRPVVARFLSALNVPHHALRYAPETTVEAVLDKAFPGLAPRRRKREPTLPSNLKVEESDPEAQERIEDLARRSSFMERVFREVEAEGEWEEAPSESDPGRER